MNPPAPAAQPELRSGRQATWRLTTILLTGFWALSGATLCHAAFESSARPAQTTLTAVPLHGHDWTVLAMAAFALAIPLALAPFLTFASGLRYLRSVSLTGRYWCVGWSAATIASLAVEALLIRAVVVYFADGRHLPGPASAHSDHGPAQLAAGFVFTGLTMIVIIVSAMRLTARAPAQP
jgi:hypothetical protein